MEKGVYKNTMHKIKKIYILVVHIYCYDLMDYRFVSLLLLLSLFPFRIGRGPNVSLLVVGPEKRPGL